MTRNIKAHRNLLKQNKPGFILYVSSVLLLFYSTKKEVVRSK